MLKRLSLLLAFLVPLTALAVEIRPADFYDDVRTSSPESVGINLLTREGVVQGYGNRIFGPTRLVNRAEFLKIALLSTPEAMRPALTSNGGCFPDAPDGEWFSVYVCSAKAAGVIQGNPDGLFHPERTVQYDEALKMLTLLFGYDVGTSDAPDWGQRYYDASAERGTDLPVRITFATPLTRAAAARLAGAFVAEAAGSLDAYRLAESGEYTEPSSSSSESSVASSESSSVSSVTSSSSSSSAAPLFSLPPVPHFLLTGEASDAIASGVLHPSGEAAAISIVQVKLFQEVRSVDRLEVVTEDGTVLATLKQRTTTDISDYKQTFDGTVLPEDRVTLPADTDTTVILRAAIKTADLGGFSEELLHVRSFNATLLGKNSSQSVNIPLPGPFPKHQTSFGRILEIAQVGEISAPAVSGTGTVLGSFTFRGDVESTRSLSLTGLTFSVTKSDGTMFTNVMLRNPDTGGVKVCTYNQTALTFSCPTLPSLVGGFSASNTLRLDLQSDVTVPQGGFFHADLVPPGSPEELGAVEWTEGSGNFRWVESVGSPLARGTRFE